MDISNVANRAVKGTNAERNDEVVRRTPRERTVVIPAALRDEASISASGRAKAASLDVLAERARVDIGRESVVAAALERLRSGELAGPTVLEETARRLRDSGFLAG